MSIRELIHLISAKDYRFEIVTEGTQFKRKSVAEILAEYNSLEEYFKKIAELNKLTQIGIQLFAKNGTSWLRKGFFLIPITAVEKPLIPVESSTKPLQTPSKQNPMDTNAQILQIKLDMLNERMEEYKSRNKELERKNDELYTENTRLIRENGTIKDKHELEFKSKELDLKSEQSSGLNGVMESVKTLPPEAWQFLAGFIPNHPMGKLPQGNLEEGIGETGEKHENEDAQVYIDSLKSLLLSQPVEVVAMLSMVAESLINKPQNLKNIYVKLFPNSSNKTTNKTE